MGNTTSTKRQSPETKALIVQQKAAIKEKLRTDCLKIITENSALVTVEQQRNVQVALRAQELLDRDTKPLVKDDLVAILLRLDPNRAADTDFSKLAMGDLIFAIRASVISPPSSTAVVAKPQPTITLL